MPEVKFPRFRSRVMRSRTCVFRRPGLLIIALLVLSAACHSPAPAQPAAPASSYRLVDAMPAFWRVMDATASQADAAWLAAYRAEIIGPHRAVFALARGGLDDSSLVRFRRSILRNADQYRALSDSLPAKIAAEWTRFVRAFPDTRPGAVIYLLPAPPNAISGWFRPLADHDAVVFGLNLLASARSDAQLGVLINHELVHLYHAQVNPQIRSVVTTFFMGRGNHATALHELMWIEGFAVYASQRITPGAQRSDVLHPRVAQANDSARTQSARAFRERLDVTDRATVEAFVYGGTDAVPPQAVNYLGLLVAERLASRYGLSEMARLQGAELRDAIRRELEELGSDSN